MLGRNVMLILDLIYPSVLQPDSRVGWGAVSWLWTPLVWHNFCVHVNLLFDLQLLIRFEVTFYCLSILVNISNYFALLKVYGGNTQKMHALVNWYHSGNDNIFNYFSLQEMIVFVILNYLLSTYIFYWCNGLVPPLRCYWNIIYFEHKYNLYFEHFDRIPVSSNP